MVLTYYFPMKVLSPTLSGIPCLVPVVVSGRRENRDSMRRLLLLIHGSQQVGEEEEEEEESRLHFFVRSSSLSLKEKEKTLARFARVLLYNFLF